MTALAIFGICVAITIAFVVVMVLVLGSPSLIIIILFPVLLTETVTGTSSGMFNPNGSGNKSPAFNALIILFVLLEVLLVAGILFGLYCLIFGWPASALMNSEAPMVLSALQIHRLRVVNGVLWLLGGFFLVMLLINAVRFREHIKQMGKFPILFYYILPLAAHPMAFVFLAASRKYLLHYPDGGLDLGFFAKTCAIFHVCCLVAMQSHWVYSYVTTLRNHISQLTFWYWLSLAIGLLYKLIFIYFFVCVFSSL